MSAPVSNAINGATMPTSCHQGGSILKGDTLFSFLKQMQAFPKDFKDADYTEAVHRQVIGLLLAINSDVTVEELKALKPGLLLYVPFQSEVQQAIKAATPVKSSGQLMAFGMSINRDSPCGIIKFDWNDPPKGTKYTGALPPIGSPLGIPAPAGRSGVRTTKQ